MSNHTRATGCGLTREDFHPDGDENCPDGGAPDEHPSQGSHTCIHCGREVESVEGRWIDPEATGDDLLWRETCDSNDTFTAEHEVTQYPDDHRGETC